MHQTVHLMNHGFVNTHSHMFFKTEDNLNRPADDYQRMVEFGMVPKPSRIIVTDADTLGGLTQETETYLVRIKRHSMDINGDRHPIYSFKTNDVRDILAMAVGEYTVAEAQMDGLSSEDAPELFRDSHDTPIYHPFAFSYETDRRPKKVWNSGDDGVPPCPFRPETEKGCLLQLTTEIRLPAEFHGEQYAEWLEETFPQISPGKIPTP